MYDVISMSRKYFIATLLVDLANALRLSPRGS